MVGRRVLVASVLLIAACGKGDPGKGEDKDRASSARTPGAKALDGTPGSLPLSSRSGWYRGELRTSGEPDLGPLPFFFKLPRKGATDRALLRSGDVDLPARHKWHDTGFELQFPLYRTVISGSFDAQGAVVGTWNSTSKTWGAGTMDFSARPIAKPTGDLLFATELGAAKDPKSQALAIGTWRVQGARSGAIKLTLAARPSGGLIGDYQGAGGNTVRLAGDGIDGKLRLVTFEGNGLYLLHADISGDQLTGIWRAIHGAHVWPESVTGTRESGDFELAPTVTVFDQDSALIVGKADLEGYQGKPTIVEIAGSWCVNCAYASPFLRSMYDKYKDQGLAVVTLLYEMTEDDEYNRNQAELFQAEYQIPWQVIPMSGDFASVGDNMPMALENIDLSGLPIAMFVTRSGQLRHFNTGFPAPNHATHDAVKASYENAIKDILAEK